MPDIEPAGPSDGVRVANDVDGAAVAQQMIKLRAIGETRRFARGRSGTEDAQLPATCPSRPAAACLLVIPSFSAMWRIRAVLVIPAAIRCSPSWRALRAACLVGFRRSGVFKVPFLESNLPNEIRRSEPRPFFNSEARANFENASVACRMGEGDQNCRCAKTLYSCGWELPCRWLPCGFEVGKVNGKTLDFHSFLGFLC